jgi:Leucine Rich repeat
VLQGCPVLQDLRLDRCHRVTDAAFDVNQSPFQPLIGLLSLRTISLQGCPQLTGSIVVTLNKSCVRLKYLNISQVTSRTIYHSTFSGNLLKFEQLYLIRTICTIYKFQCNQMELSAIQQLFDHNRLRHLNLSFVDEMTDDAFLNLPDYRAPSRILSPDMQKFTVRVASDSLAPTAATGEEAAHYSQSKRMRTVSRHSALQVLHLAKSRITDKGMFKMAFFPDLREVHLQWCSSITDAGITALVANCSQLEVVDLKSCSITDISLGLLGRESKQLRHLDVSWCSNITDRGIQSLSSRRPTSESLGCRTSPISTSAGRPAEDHGILSASQVLSAAGSDPISRSVPVGPVRRIASLNSISAVMEIRDASASANSAYTTSSSRTASDSNSSESSSDVLLRSNPGRHQGTTLLGSAEYEDDVLPQKLETLVIVWCLQLTDAALLSLGALPKLKQVEAVGCTLVSEASTQHLTSLGIRIVM